MREPCPKSALLAGLVLLLSAAGCSTVVQPKPEAAHPAHLILVNLGDCPWQIEILPSGGGPAQPVHLDARESREINLAAGAYEIEQTALTADAGSASTRRLTVHLKPGLTYRWRMATLLSAPAGLEKPDADNGHERK